MGPFSNFTGPFPRKGSKKGGTKSKKTDCFLRLLTFYMGRTRWTLCRHFGTFWATELLQNLGCNNDNDNDSNAEEKWQLRL